MSESTLKTQLKWQCRRGMLELDVILIPFLETHFEQLSEAEQSLFQQMLTEADPDLYTWLMGFGRCEKAELEPMIKLVREKMQITS